MSTQDTEVIVLENLADDLKARGYDVYLQPHRLLIPKFLEGYVPDLIALRSEINPNARNIVVEFIRPGQPRKSFVDGVAARFKDQQDWEFRIVRLASKPPTLAPSTESEIEGRLQEVQRLVQQSHLEPALLLAWAVLEALGRALLSDMLQRAQTASGLVQVLAENGHLMPEEADFLLDLARKRNALAHGDLQVIVERSELDKLLEVMTTLRGLVPA